MRTVHTIAELREQVRQARAAGKKIGLVPTMGNLHEGHLRLVDIAHQHAEFVVSTIFVNPLQFGANEDLDKYPRTLTADQAHLEARKCDLLFAPTVDEVYPNGQARQTFVEVPVLSDLHCGASRPGHFRGVATVVSKLFGMVQPDVAVFGQKDYQQLMVIRQMAADLCLPIKIIGAPTARADSGLALSSRNGYLSDEQRQQAAQLYQTLQQVAAELKTGGVASLDGILATAEQQLQNAGFRPDFLTVCERATLQPPTTEDTQLVILAAAFMDKTRLIDNLEVDL